MSGVNSIIHYLDDFLCVGLASPKTHRRIPLAPEKTEGPTRVLSFLGIVLDSGAMECGVLEDTLMALKEEIRSMLGLVPKHRKDLRVWHSFLESFNGRAL